MAGQNEFRIVMPSDVERFVQVPMTLEVDAYNLVMSVEEDTMKNYEKQFLVMDYVIYADIPRSKLFNSQMDWKYRMNYDTDASGVYQGVRAVDAHDIGSPWPLLNPIINRETAKVHLASDCTSTRFCHYKHCNRFFKYSFKVGDELLVAGQRAQLYAVYLDGTTGAALPYWRTVNYVDATTQQVIEQTQFFYASGIDLAAVLGGLNTTGIPFHDPITNVAQLVTIVCPPHPEFVESVKQGSVGGPLAVSQAPNGTPVLRQVGPKDSSGNLVPLDISPASLVEYTAANDNRQLMLYWVYMPSAQKLYLGERMYVSWCSADVAGEPSRDTWGPICDIDAPGSIKGAPASVASVLPVNRFVLTGDVRSGEYGGLRSGITDPFASGSAKRMYLPTSRYVVQQLQPRDPDVHNNGLDPFDVPFAYIACNDVEYDDPKASVIGGRIMQILCNYMFDSSAKEQLAYFPFLLNESKNLTDKIVDQLSINFMRSATQEYNARSDVLHQILIKHGKRYFEEHAVLNEVSGTKVGNVLDVLKRIDEMFLMFTATIVTSVSNRSKDRIEIIRLVQVPIVLRVYDDSAPPPPPPSPYEEVLQAIQTMPRHQDISWFLDAQNMVSYSGGSTWKDARAPDIVTLSVTNKGTDVITPSGYYMGVPFNGVATKADTPQVVGFSNNGLSVLVFYYRNGSPSSPGGISSQLSNSSAPEGGVLLSINVVPGATDLSSSLLLYERYALAYNANGEPAVKMVAGGIPNGMAADNKWHMRAYTWSADGKTATAYYNGMLLTSTTTLTAVPLVNSDVSIGINPADSTNALNGTIGLYIMYNKELLDYEVADIYEQYKGRFDLV